VRVADKAFCEPPLLMSSIIHTERVNMEPWTWLPDLHRRARAVDAYRRARRISR